MRIIILGGPGDGIVAAQTVRDMARAGREIELAGFLNDRLPVGEQVLGAPVLGTLKDWATLPDDVMFLPALHKVGDMPARSRLIRDLGIPPQRWASVVHPTACIADDVQVGWGCYIAAHVAVQPGARLGNFVSIRAGGSIGHDVVLHNFTYVGSNATLTGRAQMEEGAHLGPNAVVIDRVIVGTFSIVGAGAAMMKNAHPYSVYLGNPARRLRGLSRE